VDLDRTESGRLSLMGGRRHRDGCCGAVSLVAGINRAAMDGQAVRVL
jgi:hypothetical protein